MEKLLLKKIGLFLIIPFIVMFTFITSYIYMTESKAAISNLEEMLQQMEIIYQKSEWDVNQTIKILEEDYLKRAYTIDFILSNNPNQSYDSAVLEKIKDLKDVEAIHLIDEKGTIVHSSESEDIGLNLKEHEESSAFWSLIDSKDLEEHVIQLDAISIQDKESKIYVGVKSQLENYSVIQIAVKKDTFDSLIQNFKMESILNNIPVDRGDSVFIIDGETGEIEGITKNNNRHLTIQNVTTKEEFIKILEESSNGKKVKINGSTKYLKTKKIDNKIIGTYVEASNIHQIMISKIFYLLVGIIIALILVLLIFRYNLKKYVLNDLFAMESNIKELMNGNYDIHFQTEYKTELQQVSDVLDDWKDIYKHRSQRLTRIISSISSKIAIFECLHSINQVFFSDNLSLILRVDHDI